MSAGITVLGPSGTIRIGPGDFLSRLMGTGSLRIVWPGNTVFVPWPGMTATDEWAVALAGDGVVNQLNGGFQVTGTNAWYSSAPNIFYSVYRR